MQLLGKPALLQKLGNCLVSSAFKNDTELICVVLGGFSTSNKDISTRFTDSKKLYEYIFNNFSYKNLTNINELVATTNIVTTFGKNTSIDLVANKNICVYISNDDFEKITPVIDINSNISVPITTSDTLGTIKFLVNGTEYTADLISNTNIYPNNPLTHILAISFVFILIFGFIKIIIHKKKNKIK